MSAAKDSRPRVCPNTIEARSLNETEHAIVAREFEFLEGEQLEIIYRYDDCFEPFKCTGSKVVAISNLRFLKRQKEKKQAIFRFEIESIGIKVKYPKRWDKIFCLLKNGEQKKIGLYGNVASKYFLDYLNSKPYQIPLELKERAERNRQQISQYEQSKRDIVNTIELQYSSNCKAADEKLVIDIANAKQKNAQELEQEIQKLRALYEQRTATEIASLQNNYALHCDTLKASKEQQFTSRMVELDTQFPQLRQISTGTLPRYGKIDKPKKTGGNKKGGGGGGGGGGGKKKDKKAEKAAADDEDDDDDDDDEDSDED